MSEDLRIEYILLRIRDKLNSDKIKLWLPPYYDVKSKEESDSIQAVQKLADEYSTALELDINICFTSLKELQRHALDKLREKEVYKETGVAVIKVKLSGLITSNNNTTGKILSIRMNLSSLTISLQEAVSEQIEIPPDRIKLISSGKVLNSNVSLEAQGVKHGIQIMAVVITVNSAELQEYEKKMKMLARMKADVKLLTNRIGPEQETYLQVADQSGKTLNLPPEEKNALVSAMALHEKGRAALKKEEYALALVFLLEADKEFSICNSQLLNSVDNYALLNLDIAWCYLCLKNVTQLPDAEKRLKLCESKFKFSYGPNLERLIALKGSSGNEAALLMRLHLLQGIVLFHQNKHEEARLVLREAQQELVALKVDDNSLHMLIELGLTAAEARIGLRATKGCINSAMDYIHTKRQEREEIRKKEKEQREKEKLGMCQDGLQYVEPSLVKSLEAMGFSRAMAVEALRYTNNMVNDAINVIHQQPEILTSKITSMLDNPAFKELIRQITTIGYDTRMAIRALKKHNGNVEQAVEELMTKSGHISGSDEDIDNENEDGARASSMLSKAESRLKQLKKEKEAYDRFSEGMSTNVDDHLDLTLEQEEQFLGQYLSLLN